MKRAKPKKKHITLTGAKVDKMKSDICDEATQKAMLIFLAALHDDYGFGEKRLCQVLETASKYGEYIDKHLVSIRQTQEIIEKGTGLKFKGF